jgi:hypothetical protein
MSARAISFVSFAVPRIALTTGVLALACGEKGPRYELFIVSPIDQARISSGIFTDTADRCEEIGRKYLSAYCNSIGPHQNSTMAIICEVPTQKVVEHAWECRPY